MVAAGDVTADWISGLSVSISAAAAGLASVVALTVGQNGGDPEMVAREKEDGAKATAAKGESAPEADRSGAQDRRLTPGEIDGLKERGIDPHDLKPNSRYDLFKDKNGNILVKPKSGVGPGDPTGIKVHDE